MPNRWLSIFRRIQCHRWSPTRFVGSLALCNCYEHIDCGSQSTDLFPAILIKCNRCDTRDFIGFMLSELVVTQRLHLANQNYFARSVSSNCFNLDSWLNSWPIYIYQVYNAICQHKYKKMTFWPPTTKRTNHLEELNTFFVIKNSLGIVLYPNKVH